MLVHAVHVIVELQDPLVLQVSMDATVSMDSLANREIAVQQLLVVLLITVEFKHNANVRLQLAIPVPVDQKDPTDQPAMEDLPVLMVNQVAPDLLDQQVQVDLQEMLALQVLPAKLEKLERHVLVPLDNQARLANPVDPAQLVLLAAQEKMVAPVQSVLPAMLVLLALLAKLVALAQVEIPVVLALQVLAINAHRLVRLLVSKHIHRTPWHNERFDKSISSKLKNLFTFVPYCFFITAY